MLPDKNDRNEVDRTGSVPEFHQEHFEILRELAREYDDLAGGPKHEELFYLLNEILDPPSSDTSLRESVSALNPPEDLIEENSDLPELVENELSAQGDQNLVNRDASSLPRSREEKSRNQQFKSDKHLHSYANDISEVFNLLHGKYLLDGATDFDISRSVVTGKYTGKNSDSGKIEESLIVGKYPFWNSNDVDVMDSIIVSARPGRIDANIHNSVVFTPEDAFYVESYNPTSDNWDDAKVGIHGDKYVSSVGLPGSQNDRYPKLEESANQALEMEFDIEFSPDIFFAEDISEFEHKLESHYRQAGLQVPEEFNTDGCAYSTVLGESIIHPEVGEMWDSTSLEQLRAYEFVLHESVEQLVDQVRGDNRLVPEQIVGDEIRKKNWEEGIIDPMTEYVVAVSAQRLATKYSELIGVPDDVANFYFENKQPLNSLESLESYEDNFKFAGDKESRAKHFLNKIETVEGLEYITRNYLR